MTPKQVQAKKLIEAAEKALGRHLSIGERTDLILDNMEAVKDSVEAHVILNKLGLEWEAR